MPENHSQTLLSDLRPGDEATVVDLAADGAIKQQLLEMGFTRGARIRVERYAPMGDPMELVVKGYHLSLRKEECQLIIINREA
jgi:Fe2+ transport system protein FeoA